MSTELAINPIAGYDDSQGSGSGSDPKKGKSKGSDPKKDPGKGLIPKTDPIKEALQAKLKANREISLKSIEACKPFEKGIASILFTAAQVMGREIPPFNLNQSSSARLKAFSLACNKQSIFKDLDNNLMVQVQVAQKLFHKISEDHAQNNFTAEVIRINAHLTCYNDRLKDNKFYASDRQSKKFLLVLTQNGISVDQISKDKIAIAPILSDPQFLAVKKAILPELAKVEIPFSFFPSIESTVKAAKKAYKLNLYCPACEMDVVFSSKKATPNLQVMLCPCCKESSLEIKSVKAISLEEALKALIDNS